MEALYFGVPLVLFPQMLEQATNARRAAQLGAGVVLQSDGKEELTAEKLRAQVERVASDPAYRQNAQKISASLDSPRDLRSRRDSE